MTVFQEDQNFLTHYGVKGMRWGVNAAGAIPGKAVGRHGRKVARARNEARGYIAPQQPRNPIRNIGIGIGVGIVGGLAVKNYLETFGRFTLRELNISK